MDGYYDELQDWLLFLNESIDNLDEKVQFRHIDAFFDIKDARRLLAYRGDWNNQIISEYYDAFNIIKGRGLNLDVRMCFYLSELSQGNILPAGLPDYIEDKVFTPPELCVYRREDDIINEIGGLRKLPAMNISGNCYDAEFYEYYDNYDDVYVRFLYLKKHGLSYERALDK